MSKRFSSQAMMDEAVQSTGLNDFGEIPFADGLEVLVDALNAQKDLYDNTIHYLQTKMTQILANRLQITQLIQRHPDILSEAIKEPIIITGLPRTGTTILQTLIALDPACRFLRNWESAMNICPPPAPLVSAADPRIQAFHHTIESLLQIAPVLRAINGLNFIAGGTAECQNLMAHGFRSMEYCAGFGLRSYGQWLLSCDMKPGYQYHQLLLKILQYHAPNERWVLKAPMHLIALEMLLAEYPDARIVFTHRDPFAAMLSGTSLVYRWSTLASENPDPKAFGRWFPGLWEKAMRRALAGRTKGRPDRFFDVYFNDLNSDPVGTVRSIYAHFGLTVSLGHQKRMQVWLRDHPRSSFGKHSYSADEFDLNRDEVEDSFAFYKNQFGV